MGRFPHFRSRTTYPGPLHTAVQPATAPWDIAYHLDFRTQSSEDFASGGDGDYTIDGRTWAATNTGAVDTRFELENGTGIVIEPDANTDWSASSKTAPYLSVDLAALVPDYTEGDRLVVQMILGSDGLDDDDQAYGLMVSSAYGLNPAGAVATSYASSAPVVRASRIWGSTATADAAVSDEPPVLALEWISFIFAPCYHDVAAWPRPGEMTRSEHESSATNFKPRVNAWPFYASDTALRIWAERPSGANGFTATFTGLRVLRQRI